MYTPPAFREDDRAAIHAAIRGAGLGQFVTATAEGPMATPLPFLLDPDEGAHGTLYAHLARANPQWRTPPIGPALVIFMGPDAYVSPALYAQKAIDGRVVPTWNYLTVQASGPPEFFDDPTRLRTLVARLTERHEAPRPTPWSIDDAPADYLAAQLKGIVGVRLPITHLAAKRKMSQNRPAEDRARVKASFAGMAVADEMPD